jgi:ABC-type transport system involved in multi-copper enzyme maturation permease subunit
MLSKPIRRGIVILGKFTGFSLVITIVMCIETAILLAVLMMKGIIPDTLFFFALLGIWIKLEIILALILFFSTWLSPMVAMFMTITSYIIGHSGYTVLEYGISSHNTVSIAFARFLLAFFPNLTAMNLKNYV